MGSQGEWSDSSAGLSSIEGVGEEDWGKSPRFPRRVQQGQVGEPWSQSRLQRSILRADLPHTLAGFSYCPGELSSVQCCSRDGLQSPAARALVSYGASSGRSAKDNILMCATDTYTARCLGG